MENRPIDRIKALTAWLIEHGVIKSIRQFEEICGLSRHYVRNLSATEKGNPGVDIIASIFEAFPSVSLKFLITGKGKMFAAKDEAELAERMRLDIVSKEVLHSAKGKKDIKEALKSALLDHKDDLSAEEKIALLERLL